MSRGFWYATFVIGQVVVLYQFRTPGSTLRYRLSIKPRLTRARRESLMAPLSMDRRRDMLQCPSPIDSAISSRELLTRSQLGLLICSLAPHISLIQTAYIVLLPTSRSHPSIYPLEPMRVTSCGAVKGSASIVLSVTRLLGTSSASSSNAAGSARSLNVLGLMGI